MFRFNKEKTKDLVGYAISILWILQFNIVFDTIKGAHVNLGMNIGPLSLGCSFGYWSNPALT